jgi:flagellar assembly protein FliH
MSLSKYYKDSSSFKREKIVDSNSPNLDGWKSTTKTPETTFKPGSISTPQQTSNNTAISSSKPDSNSITKPSPPSTPSPPPNTPNPDKTSPPSPADLSNYVSLDEAEEKAVERYHQGIEEGIAKATEDYGSAVQTLTTICEQLDTVRETIIGNSNDELTEFAIIIAEKIIRLSLREQDQSIIATIQEALSRAVKSDEFTIFINPDDYQIITDKSADLIAGVSGLSNIVIKTDSTIEQGGAKIESENCIIDATVATQFETIRDEILKAKD